MLFFMYVKWVSNLWGLNPANIYCLVQSAGILKKSIGKDWIDSLSGSLINRYSFLTLTLSLSDPDTIE